MIFRLLLTTLILSAFLLSACDEDSDIVGDNNNLEDTREDNQIDTLSTSNGVLFVRTPEEYFQSMCLESTYFISYSSNLL